jgi:hypothetical protein
MRNELRRVHIGKYEGGMLIDSFIGGGDLDDEIGESEYDSFYGILRGDLVAAARIGAEDAQESLTPAEERFLNTQAGAIIHENSQGFVDVSYYDTEDELDEAWNDAIELVDTMEQTEESD